MSDPFRDDREAQLARANALAIENEQLKRERDELKAKLEAIGTGRAPSDRPIVDPPGLGLDYMRDKLAEIKGKTVTITTADPHPQEAKSTKVPQITFRIRSNHLVHGLPKHTVTFDQRVIKVGRVPSAHLRIEDGSVARMHAMVEVPGAADTAYVVDLGSMNGTIVNGQKVNKMRLKTGDVLRIGEVEMDLEIVDMPLPPKPGTP